MTCSGFIRASLFTIYRNELVLRRRVIRIELQCAEQAGCRHVGSTALLKCNAKTMVVGGSPWVDRDGFSDEFDGEGRVTHLRCQHSQEMESVGVLRTAPKYLLIDLFGFA